jgi:hypothetical protein
MFEDGEETGDILKAKPTLVSATKVQYQSGAEYEGGLDEEGFPSGRGVLRLSTGVRAPIESSN